MRSINDEVIRYPEIGEVLYRRNLRARRLTISIRNAQSVRVTIPGLLSFKSAESFVLSKSKWIVEKLSQLKSKQIQPQDFNGFRTKKHTLKFTAKSVSKIYIRVHSPDIEIIYPESLEMDNLQVLDAAKRGIEIAYRAEAYEYLPGRVSHFAEKYGFTYHSVKIKKISSRWGSCSAKNNINLSIYLMKLPEELIDFIVLHELCHTKHKNHGKRFWNELNVVTDGKAKELSRQISAFSARI